MSKLAVAIIGAGHMGQTHADAWQQIPEARIAIIMDKDPVAAQALAEQTGARWTDNAQAAISDTEINVVSVCTPTFLHPELTIYAAEHGKHVLCEKPIALSLDDAQSMLAAAEKNHVQFSVGLMRRHSAIIPELRAWVAERHLGPTLMAHTTNIMPLRPKRAMHDANANGGPLIDMIVHFVDLWVMLFNSQPVSIQAQGMKLAADRPEIAHISEKAIDTAAVLVKFASGDCGNIFVSWGMPPEGNIKQHEEFILGAGGRLNLKFQRDEQFAEWQQENGETVRLFHSTESMYHREIAEFAQAVIEEDRTVTTAQAAHMTLRVSLAALESIKTGQEVQIN